MKITAKEWQKRREFLSQFGGITEAHVAFSQEELSGLVSKGIRTIYLANNQFEIPLDKENIKYIGLGKDVIAKITSPQSVKFGKLGISFENVRFDKKYQAIHKEEDLAKSESAFGEKIKAGKLVLKNQPIYKGMTVCLGQLEKRPIQWIVADIKEKAVLLISKYAVGIQRYNSADKDITWEQCTLRQWLNGEFYKQAFKFVKTGTVWTTEVPAEPNPEHSTNPGNVTRDKLFLLSSQEVEKYLKSARNQVCHLDSKTSGGRIWWLRTPGRDGSKAATVLPAGTIFNNGVSIIAEKCVRPACWVNLDLLKE